MLPLVSVPDFVHQYARRYRDLFSPSLLDHFERYFPDSMFAIGAMLK